MGFKLQAPFRIDNVPQYEVAFQYDNQKDGSPQPVARANKNFSIIYNKNDHDSGTRETARHHEGEHLKSMLKKDKKGNPELDYSPAGVTYKGKFHDRNAPGFNEADKNLPYEKPAYEAGAKKDPSTLEIKPKHYQSPGFNEIGTKSGDDADQVNANEDFGPAMNTKRWYSPRQDDETNIIGVSDVEKKIAAEADKVKSKDKKTVVKTPKNIGLWKADPNSMSFNDAAARERWGYNSKEYIQWRLQRQYDVSTPEQKKRLDDLSTSEKSSYNWKFNTEDNGMSDYAKTKPNPLDEIIGG